MSGESHFPYPGNDPGQLSALHLALTTAAKQLRTLSSDASDASAILDRAWRGESAAMAHRKVATTVAAVNTLAPLLDRGASAVASYRTTVMSLRPLVDELRSTWTTLSSQLANAEAEVRSAVLLERSGDVSASAANSATGHASHAVSTTSSKMELLQKQYNGLVRRNNTAATTCASALARCSPPRESTGSGSPGDGGESPLKQLWEDTESTRAALGAKGAWDIFAGDTWVSKVGESAQLPGEAVKGLNAASEQMWDSIVSLSDHPSIEEIGNRVSRFEQLDGAVGYFTHEWADTSKLAKLAKPLAASSRVLTGLSVLGDLSTLAAPEDHGVMGNVDRGAAVVNLGGMAAEAGILGDSAILGTELTVPGVGEVAAAGTALYIGGDYLYHHWTPFHNVCDDVGHTTVSVAKGVGHTAVSVTKDVGHGLSSGWHAATGWL